MPDPENPHRLTEKHFAAFLWLQQQTALGLFDPTGIVEQIESVGAGLPGPSENGTACTPSTAALDDFDQKFLAALLNLQALDQDHAHKRGEIVLHLNNLGAGVKPGARKLDRSARRLKDAQLIDSASSAGGGYWLLPKGQDQAQSIASTAQSIASTAQSMQ